MSNLNLKPSDIDYLFSPEAIRDSARKMYEHVNSGAGHFKIHSEKLNGTVQYVLDVIHKKYPDLNIPFHSRWGHFRVGNTDRTQQLLQLSDKLEMARTKLDLVITSVLLDAGAGAKWSYFEKSTATTIFCTSNFSIEPHCSRYLTKVQLSPTETIVD